MKKILSFVCLAWSVAANAQFTPGQILTAAELNNQFSLYAPLSGAAFVGGVSGPSFSGAFSGPLNGSVGSITPSTGVFTNLTATGTVTVPAGTVALSGLASQVANTVVANATGSSASPTAISVPSCSTSSSALQWTSGTGLGCNSAINASSLGGTGAASYALLASPTFTGTPAAPTATATTNTTQIATTAMVNSAVTGGSLAGSFATLASSGNFTPSQTNGIVGTTTNNNANAGSVGEYPNQNFTSVALSNNSIVNLTSVNLTAGDWDVQCFSQYLGSGSTTWTAAVTWISTTSAALPAVGLYNQATLTYSAISSPAFGQFAPVQRELLASTTTVYCSSLVLFSAGTLTATGFIRARRVR